MDANELAEILKKHKMWLLDEDGGVRADLSYSDLRNSDLSYSDLSYSDLRDADIDYSCWPLWCGSLKVYVDDRIAIQLLYHTLSVVQHSPYVSNDVKRTLLTTDAVAVANRFHRVDECGKLIPYTKEVQQ